METNNASLEFEKRKFALEISATIVSSLCYGNKWSTDFTLDTLEEIAWGVINYLDGNGGYTLK